jgi:hypothetical protein
MLRNEAAMVKGITLFIIILSTVNLTPLPDLVKHADLKFPMGLQFYSHL